MCQLCDTVFKDRLVELREIHDDPNVCPVCEFGDVRVLHTTPLGHQCTHLPHDTGAVARLLDES